MLWVYVHYTYFTLSVQGSNFRRENEVGPGTKMVKRSGPMRESVPKLKLQRNDERGLVNYVT